MLALVFFALLHSSPLRDCSAQRPCTITAYADRQIRAGLVLDWRCRDHSYDGHQGTDFGIGGFGEMDRGRPVFATAAGVVEAVLDGLDDRCTDGLCGGDDVLGNHVVIRHPDGSEARYGHLRRDSIQVAVGDAVDCSSQLAEVGSSGASNGPHLHLELRREGQAVEMFAGDCGAEQSAWRDQGGYRELPSSSCPESTRDDAQLIDETMADGSVVPPSSRIDKTWTLANAGSSTWDDRVEARREDEAPWQAPDRLSLPLEVPPGAELSLTASIETPDFVGENLIVTYRLYRDDLPFGPSFGLDWTTGHRPDAGAEDGGAGDQTAPEAVEGGCSCGAVDGSLLGLLALLGAGRRRR